jgi:hypothetical protein
LPTKPEQQMEQHVDRSVAPIVPLREPMTLEDVVSALRALATEVQAIHSCVDNVRAEARENRAEARENAQTALKHVADLHSELNQKLDSQYTYVRVIADAANVARSEAIHAADDARRSREAVDEALREKRRDRESSPEIPSLKTDATALGESERAPAIEPGRLDPLEYREIEQTFGVTVAPAVPSDRDSSRFLPTRFQQLGDLAPEPTKDE